MLRVDPLRRGRPDPAPLHPGPRPGQRHREGRAPRHARASAGGWSRSSASTCVLYEGRGELLPSRRPRPSPATRACASDAAALDAASRACDAVDRLFDPGDPHPASTTCSPTSSRCSTPTPARATRANQLAFRLKLLLAAGFAPQLAACASCGEREHLRGFSGAAGGVVCSACEASAFPLAQEAHDFLVGAARPPLPRRPTRRARARARPSARSSRRSSITPHAERLRRPQ